MNQFKLETLLQASGNIVATHRKEIKEKGEDFNIFSILNMESNETKTHSNMLVALLNPRGNHYHGAIFLELFLEEIGYSDYSKEELPQVKVQSEFHLGKISKEYNEGGFIDVLVSFPSGNTIAIENKIYAGDQPKQMYRYSLFNNGKSTLYYLNLFGDKPSKDSLYKLGDDDYQIIAYNNEIINWLENCLKVVRHGSIIEASLKQYQIIIKRLTHTMDNTLQEKMNALILENLEEAKYIKAHYQEAVNLIRENFRTSLCNSINNSNMSVKARVDKDIDHNFSKIWLNSEALNAKGVQLGIESFSGKGNTGGRMFIGILDKKREYETIVDGDQRLNSYWPVIRFLKAEEDNPLSLASTEILEKLHNNPDYFNEMLDASLDQIKSFVETYHKGYFSNIKNETQLGSNFKESS
jgi:hypothetical protein